MSDCPPGCRVNFNIFYLPVICKYQYFLNKCFKLHVYLVSSLLLANLETVCPASLSSSFSLHSVYDLQNNMKCTQDGPRICTPSISICKFLHKSARTTIQTRVYGNRSRGRLTAETTFPREGKVSL